MLAHLLSHPAMVGTQAPPPPGRRVLVAEDEWLTARELETTLRDAGYEVLGPAPSVPAAMRILATQDPPDVALLDVNLRGEAVTPLAEALAARGYAGERHGDVLVVNGATPEQVGGIAAEQNVTVLGLAARERSLEAAFFEMTADRP